MKKKTKTEPIEKIRKRFHKQWLLIAVDQVDEKRTIPLTGKLLAHSPDRLDIHRAAMKLKGRTLMTVYSNDWPKDLAAAFYAHLPPLR